MVHHNSALLLDPTNFHVPSTCLDLQRSVLQTKESVREYCVGSKRRRSPIESDAINSRWLFGFKLLSRDSVRRWPSGHPPCGHLGVEIGSGFASLHNIYKKEFTAFWRSPGGAQLERNLARVLCSCGFGPHPQNLQLRCGKCEKGRMPTAALHRSSCPLHVWSESS